MAEFVVKNDDSANREVLAYGFGLIVSSMMTYIVVLGSAFILGVIYEVLIAILVFSVMRLTIGGSHANSRIVCFIVYSSVLYSSVFLSSILNLNVFAIAALYIVNVMLLVVYAPADTAQQPIVKGKLTRKVLGLIFTSLFFGFALLIPGRQTEANILLLMATFTCVSLHPLVYRVSGCKTSKQGGVLE
ncbi:MAG: accessory gene regulator B family protein [Oscillospiraceae bacterium]|nr:accessory gene regulator B family protein [Oscillospiraceae bacterium]